MTRKNADSYSIEVYLYFVCDSWLTLQEKRNNWVSENRQVQYVPNWAACYTLLTQRGEQAGAKESLPLWDLSMEVKKNDLETSVDSHGNMLNQHFSIQENTDK